MRAVFDVRAAHPDATIIGVGGVMTGADAIELMMAGADAVQVGTATFRDPRAPLAGARRDRGVVRGPPGASVASLRGVADS